MPLYTSTRCPRAARRPKSFRRPIRTQRNEFCGKTCLNLINKLSFLKDKKKEGKCITMEVS